MNETEEQKLEANASVPLVNRAEWDKIRRLARRLPRRNPVRQFTFALIEGKARCAGRIQPLLDALARPSDGCWRERAVAAWAVGAADLTPEEKAAAASRLDRIVTNRQMTERKRAVTRSVRILVRYLLFFLVMALMNEAPKHLSLLIYPQDDAFWAPSEDSPYPLLSKTVIFILATQYLVFPFFTIFLPFISIGLDERRNSQVRLQAVRALGRLKQPLSFGALVLALQDTFSFQNEVLFSIDRILPTLAQEQYGAHNREAIPVLCRMLSDVSTSALPWSTIMKVLEKIGDKQAIPRLEWIVKTHAGDEVGRAAEKILPTLRERQRQENDPKRLVRAAGAPSEPSTLLLRPVQGSGSAEEHLLLRSISAGATNEHADGGDSGLRSE